MIFKSYLKYLLKILNHAVSYAYINLNEMVLHLHKKDYIKVLYILKKHNLCQFTTLSDITVVDYPTKKLRFELVYNFLSIYYNTRIRIIIKLTETSIAYSIIKLFPSANWFEREVWDLFGIFFQNNKDLRRILTDYGFEGHPLRKDFPLTGFIEVRYDDVLKRVVTEPIELSQKYRFFNIQTAWNSFNTQLNTPNFF